MNRTPEEVLKVANKAFEEVRVARAEAEATKVELATLKGKKAGEGAEHSKAVVQAAMAAGRPRGSVSYPQLTRMNYTLWVMQMRMALQSAGVWPAVHSKDDGFENNQDVLLVIYQGVLENEG